MLCLCGQLRASNVWSIFPINMWCAQDYYPFLLRHEYRCTHTHPHSYVSMYALVHVCIRNISWDPKYNIRFMTLSLSLSLSPPQVYLFVTDFSRLPAIGNMTILKDWQYKFVYYFAFLILILTLFHEMDIHQYHLYADCPGSIQSYSCFLSHRVDIW